jgi:hypothetical protein
MHDRALMRERFTRTSGPDLTPSRESEDGALRNLAGRRSISGVGGQAVPPSGNAGRASLTQCRNRRHDAGRRRATTAALGVHGLERSRLMSSSQTMGEARLDDRQLCYFQCHNGGPDCVRSCGALRDSSALSKAPNRRILASEPQSIGGIPAEIDLGNIM